MGYFQAASSNETTQEYEQEQLQCHGQRSRRSLRFTFVAGRAFRKARSWRADRRSCHLRGVRAACQNQLVARLERVDHHFDVLAWASGEDFRTHHRGLPEGGDYDNSENAAGTSPSPPIHRLKLTRGRGRRQVRQAELLAIRLLRDDELESI